MTLQATVSAVGYVGQGNQATYTFPFKVRAKSHLLVAQRDTADIETILVLDVGYTVPDAALDSDQGGSITLLAGDLPTDYKLVIRRNPPFEQLFDLKGEGPFFAKDHEEAYDYQTMLSQRLFDLLGNSIKLPESEVGSDLLTRIPALDQRKGKLLFFDETTGEITAVVGANFGVTPVSAFMLTVLDDASEGPARTTLGVTFTETTPAQLTANVSTWAPTLGNFRTLIRASCDGTIRTVRGLDNGVAGLEVVIVNIDVNPFNISHEDAAAGAADERFLNWGGGTVTLEQFDSVTYRYDGTSSRWRQIG